MLEIQSEAFLLRLTPVARRVEGYGGPYLDWIELRVQIEVPGFSASTRWEAMPAELGRFRQQLTQLPGGSEAELSGAEPGFVLRLKAVALGGILGTFELQADPPDGATLQGSFGIDQTYLTDLVRQVDTLMEFR